MTQEIIPQSLRDHRQYAADCSGGTSCSSIKSLIIHLIKTHHLQGQVLDYGAGKGELLSLLEHENIFRQLSGVDILTQPGHLGQNVAWYQHDLNEPITIADESQDLIICSEVIEHLENPRATFREIYRLLVPGGALLLTMPNQESIRSLVGLLLGGHFTHFLGDCYPAHITALLRLDLQRISAETGFASPSFYYTDVGGIPKLPFITWQSISWGGLRGRLFSDNIAMLVRKSPQ
jgi:2-polyprenyl-3-methyl-5-hydroxy-6-metoxy-1,4-benzoquinol methylase